MADFEKYLRAVLTGGLQGAQAGMASGRELEKAVMLEKIKRTMSPEDTELKSAQSEYYRAGAEQRRNPSLITAIIGYDEEGQPITTQMPKGTKEMLNPQEKAQRARMSRGMSPIKQKTIEDTIQTISLMGNISKASKTGKFKTGYMSEYSQNAPFHKARMSLLGTPEQAQFKSDLTDAQAAYASARTGAQRGFKEIGWLEPAMPSGDTPPEQLFAVADRASERMELNLRNTLMSSKKQGYDICEYEDTLNELMDKYPLEEYPFGLSKESKQNISPEVARQLLRESNDDKDKARKLASQRGYIF